ncbi:hypothetical protein FZEAL_8294 [Fusarium zealandicum]|uniref:Zn(2)-C6 fungal-type domain-containing protein n=1 Tax=Fusarium zealandicum TaxID=1053134 RepID=A0A8H4XHM1_9HYPO|nr:hypothetical protein FZEAL_8294 [Fusarium zealandicum]
MLIFPAFSSARTGARGILVSANAMEEVDDSLNESAARKRLRTSHACDGCRTRKTRCDGSHPCATCAATNQECTFGSEANSRSKNDIILESVLRVERSLHELKSNISVNSQLGCQHQSHLSPPNPRASSFSVSTPETSLRRRSFAIQTPASHDLGENGNNLENAVLDSMHTSTTESVLQWPHFDVFPLLRTDQMSIFHLEQSRPPLPISSNPVYPYIDAEDVDSILTAFEHNVNFWYPTMSQAQLQEIRTTLRSGVPAEDTVHCCLSLLTLALGCASQAVTDLRFTSSPEGYEAATRLRNRKMGDVYFQLALRKLHIVHLKVDSETTQCLFFTAIYFASLVRPLQAWEYLSATATRCMLLLSYPSNAQDTESEERIRRMFWSCYILESDYMAELSACPPSGIARVESSVPLPSVYHTHTSEKQQEESSLYFLACISMRRLLNRVHQLLYARDSGAAFDHARFPRIVAELQRQLDDWRDVLPASFLFSVDMEETATAAGGFLRQRYLTCKGVIYRPYLMWALSDIGSGGNNVALTIPEAITNCQACLDACLLHALNLRGFPQTVLIDTWICSLSHSMSGAMLILLAACQVPALREIIRSRVARVGDHLQGLFNHWRQISFGNDSPSVERSLWLMQLADRIDMLWGNILRQSNIKSIKPYSVSSRSCVVFRLFSTQSLLQRQPRQPTANMSWMDSWSRPSKSQATPAPYYLLPGGESTPYCHSCGRVISTRRTAATAKTNTPAKYCSSRCRTKKPGKLDRELESAFVHFLSADNGGSVDGKPATKGGSNSGKQKKSKHVKGDNRVLVTCSTVEEFVFGSHRSSMEEMEDEDLSEDETQISHAPTSLPPGPAQSASSDEDMDCSGDIQSDKQIDGDVFARMAVRSGTRMRPSQSISEVNGSVGGEKGRAERIQETDAMLEKRKQGQRRAREREMTKCAARRGVVFGFSVDGDDGQDAGGKRRLCEAVMSGKVVEPSFAKGDWAIRWRE